MSTLLTLIAAIAVAVGLLTYYFLPNQGELPLGPFRSAPRDRTVGVYDEQRRCRDVDAIRTHQSGTS
ncbi:hypothetical protein ACFO5K_08610 [Nocardia halotolerans]|uniref:Uncharacterized protein n=1 Tax=Nocardia halotolerans TaxID=1755878 RepID=A0ABV8VEX9_9NOCA